MFSRSKWSKRSRDVVTYFLLKLIRLNGISQYRWCSVLGCFGSWGVSVRIYSTPGAHAGACAPLRVSAAPVPAFRGTRSDPRLFPKLPPSPAAALCIKALMFEVNGALVLRCCVRGSSAGSCPLLPRRCWGPRFPAVTAAAPPHAPSRGTGQGGPRRPR